MRPKSNRWDDTKLGIVIGTVAPAIGVLLYYFVHQALPAYNISGLDFQEYLDMLQRPRLLSTILRGALIMNLGAFFLALNFDLTNVSNGIIAMTLAYGLLIVILHFA